MGKPRGGLRHRSIFYKTLAVVMLLSLLTVAYFAFFIARVVLREQTGRVHSLSLMSLQRVGREVDTMFDLTAKGMSQTLWSSDFVTAMVTAEPQTAERTVRMAGMLDNSVRESDLISSALLYLPHSGQVLGTAGGMVPLEHSGEKVALSGMLQELPPGHSAGDGTTWRVMRFGNRLFLVVDLSIPGTLGILFFELNQQYLMETIQSGAPGGTIPMLVYDQGYSRLLAAQSAEDAPRSIEQALRDHVGSTVQLGAGEYYQHAAALSGWHYLSPLSEATPPVSYAVGLMLPALAAYLVVSLLFSYYVTHTIYRPINRLMQLTVGGRASSSDKGAAAQNEVDYLELVYTDSLDRSQQYGQLMQSVSQEVTEQLLRRVFTDSTTDMAYIQATLEHVGLPHLLQSRCTALCGQILPPRGEPGGQVEFSLYQRGILSLLETGQTDVQIYPLFLDRATVAIALFYSEEWSITQILQHLYQLQEELLSGVQELPFDLILGRGRICSELSGLGDAWREAVRAVYYRLNASNGEHSEISRPHVDDTLYFSEKMRHIIAEVEKEQGEAYRALVPALVEEMVCSVPGGDVARVRHLCETVQETLIERLMSYHVTAEELESSGISGSARALSQQEDAQALSVHMVQFCTRALQIVAGCAGKKRYRYIDDAKAYIENHYMDSGLSLVEVSDATGISSSYLSILFPEVTGMNFTAWLGQYRVERARQYLTATSLSVTQIAYKCGFNSIQSFGRVFKKHTGMTPGQYRG